MSLWAQGNQASIEGRGRAKASKVNVNFDLRGLRFRKNGKELGTRDFHS